MTLTNKTRLDIFIASLTLFAFLFCFSILCALAKDEGTLGNGVIVNFLAERVSYIFPALLLEDRLAKHLFSSILGLASVNILLYSFLMTIIFTKSLMSIKTYRPFNTTFYSTLTILLLVLTRFIYLIATSK